MGLTKAQRHNRMLDNVFAHYHEQQAAMSIRKLIADNELEDYSRFVNANPSFTVKESFERFKQLQNIPF